MPCRYDEVREFWEVGKDAIIWRAVQARWPVGLCGLKRGQEVVPCRYDEVRGF